MLLWLIHLVLVVLVLSSLNGKINNFATGNFDCQGTFNVNSNLINDYTAEPIEFEDVSLETISFRKVK